MDKQCAECGKTFRGKGTKCSACVKRAQRSKTEGGEGEQKEIITPLGAVLTSTDMSFKEALGEIYLSDLRQGVCLICGVKFDTHLELAKVCSYECQVDLVDRLAGKRDE